ncbi:MAG: L,D-transpeptidase, partial [Ilumatobacteraceae bacterium]
GSDAPELPEDAGQDTGKRVVYQRSSQRVWAIDEDEQIVRSYLVSGSRYRNEVPGWHKVYSRSESALGWDLQADLPYMIRYTQTERGHIGFHAIPSWRDSGEKLQTIEELGQRLSGGCTRQAPQDAEFLWSFADVGTRVLVL